MSVNPADMETCNIKNTCVGGVNDGVAYDPANPCPPFFDFNAFACDCEPGCQGGIPLACETASTYCLTVTPNLVGYSRNGNCGNQPSQVATKTTPVKISGVSTSACPVWTTVARSDCGDAGTGVNQYILLAAEGSSTVLWSSGSAGGYSNDYWEGGTPQVAANCDCICWREAKVTYTYTSGGSASCGGNCSQGPASINTITFPYPVNMKADTGTGVNWSTLSSQCGYPGTSGTYKAIFGADRWYEGNGNWSDTNNKTWGATSGASDALYFLATGKNGLVYGGWCALGWTGAIGCTFSSAAIIDVEWKIQTAC